MMYTLNEETFGAYFTFSRISRISSTPLFDAASISITSGLDPTVILLHNSHSLQGSAESPRFGQLTAFANIFAALVFPVPRGPVNK